MRKDMYMYVLLSIYVCIYMIMVVYEYMYT